MNLRRLFCLLIAFHFVATVARGSEWQTDYEQALATAKAANKCVLLDFTGSDWCGPCIQLKKAVFSKEAFLNYAQANLVLVELDYPQRKKLPEKVTKQNERLSHQYGIDNSGYPTVILLSPEGKILGQMEGYGGQRPADIISWIEKLRGKSS
jgi:thioredoxin-related protein